MQVTPLYAGLLALLFLYLSFCVIRLRRTVLVGVGDGGDERLQRAIRVHGNFAEYVPFALLLIGMAELDGIGGVWVHILGAMLLAGRALHAYGVSKPKEDLRIRIAGMVMTFSVLLVGAIVNLFL